MNMLIIKSLLSKVRIQGITVMTIPFKSLKGNFGEVEISTPRDRNSTDRAPFLKITAFFFLFRPNLSTLMNVPLLFFHYHVKEKTSRDLKLMIVNLWAQRIKI